MRKSDLHRNWRSTILLILVGCASESRSDEQQAGSGAVSLSQPVSACEGCSLKLDKIAVLGSIDDPVLPNQETHAIRVASGGYRVVGPDRNSILFYDEQGNFLKEGGSSGNGPGELIDLAELAPGLADSLLARRRDNLIAVLAPDGKPVRSFRLPQNCMLQQVDGRFPCRVHTSAGSALEWRQANGELSTEQARKSGVIETPTVRWLVLGVLSDSPFGLVGVRDSGALLERIPHNGGSGGPQEKLESSGFDATQERELSKGGRLIGQPMILSDSAGFIFYVRGIDTTALERPTTPYVIRTEAGLVPAVAATFEKRDSGTVTLIDAFSREGKWLHQEQFEGMRLHPGGQGLMFELRSNSDLVLNVNFFKIRFVAQGQ